MSLFARVIMKRTLQHETLVVHRKQQTTTSVVDKVHTYTMPKPNWFKVRIDQLCDELGVSKSKLGTDAGLSHATIGKWIRMAESGAFNPRLEQVELLAKHTGRPVAWFLEEGRHDPLGSPMSPSLNSLSAADQAAKQLTELDGVPPDQAWLLMRELLDIAADSLYVEARRLLKARSIVGLTSDDLAAHEVKARKVTDSSAPLGRRHAR